MLNKTIVNFLIAGTILCGSGSFSADKCCADVVASYSFNAGTTVDDTGNGNDATNSGATVTQDRFGNDGHAFQFDGVNDYMQTPLSSNSLPLAFSVWFRVDAIGGEQSIVDSDQSGRYGHSLILDYGLAAPSSGNLDVQYHNGAVDAGNDAKVTAGIWHHAVVNFGSTLQLYLDNQLVLSQAYSPPTPDGSNFRLGRHNSGDPQWFGGAIDDVAFFDATLNADDVNDLFKATNPVPEPASGGVLILAALLLTRRTQRRVV